MRERNGGRKGGRKGKTGRSEHSMPIAIPPQRLARLIET